MSFDLAIDYNTGDLKLSPRRDIDVRTGTEVLAQRIRVRLRVIQGEWVLDPENGALGSRMIDLMRMSIWQAELDAPRIIREALEPMDDIQINSVTCQIDPKDNRRLIVGLQYTSLETGTAGEEETLDMTVAIGT